MSQNKLPRTRRMSEPVTLMTEIGKTSTVNGHSHEYTIDADGNGQTNVVDGHIHDIDGGVILDSDGHSHILIKVSH